MTMAPQRRTTVLDAAQPAAGPAHARCGACVRWRRLSKPGTRFGACRWPGLGKKPYWHAQHPDGDLVTADCHGAGCEAFRERKT